MISVTELCFQTEGRVQ